MAGDIDKINEVFRSHDELEIFLQCLPLRIHVRYRNFGTEKLHEWRHGIQDS